MRTLTSNTLTQYNHSIYGTLQSNKPYNIYTMIRDLLVYSLDYYFITDSYMLTRNEWDIDIPHIPSQNWFIILFIDYYTKVFQLITNIITMEPEPRQLFNIHNLCIVKHASKVSYMQIQPKRFYDHTQHTYTHTHTQLRGDSSKN